MASSDTTVPGKIKFTHVDTFGNRNRGIQLKFTFNSSDPNHLSIDCRYEGEPTYWDLERQHLANRTPDQARGEEATVWTRDGAVVCLTLKGLTGHFEAPTSKIDRYLQRTYELVSSEDATSAADGDQITETLSVYTGLGARATATMIYDPTEPYTIQINLQMGSVEDNIRLVLDDKDPNEVVEWRFARDLLLTGVTTRTGDGDVVVCPVESNPEFVHVAVSSPHGNLVLAFPRQALTRFLRRITRVVPQGRESEFLDIDAGLALLQWGDPHS